MRLTLRPKHLSRKGAEFVAAFEGFKAEPYNDPTNNATIGFGHLLHLGPVTARDKELWGTLTRAQALALLRDDAEKAAKSVAANAKPWRQTRLDAMTSFAFNVGVGAFEGSTLLKKHKSKDYQGAAKEFGRWNKSKGRVLSGLTRRRAAESLLYLKGKYG